MRLRIGLFLVGLLVNSLLLHLSLHLLVLLLLSHELRLQVVLLVRDHHGALGLSLVWLRSLLGLELILVHRALLLPLRGGSNQTSQVSLGRVDVVSQFLGSKGRL